MTVVESYLNPFCVPPRDCLRYLVHPRILVGGNVVDAADWNHLRDNLGMRSVLNVDGRSDDEKGIERLMNCPVVDDGSVFAPQAVRRALMFAEDALAHGPIYVHCHIGVSRSPAFAYGIMRYCFKMSQKEALKAIIDGGGEYGSVYDQVEKHRVYMASVDAVLTKESSD